MEDVKWLCKWHSTSTPACNPQAAFNSFSFPMVSCASNSANSHSSIHSEMLLSLSHGEGRVFAPCRSELLLCSLVFMASHASVIAINQSRECYLPSSLVCFLSSCHRARLKDIRTVAHDWEAVSVKDGKSNKPFLGVGKLGRCPSSRTDGMERECDFNVLIRHAWHIILYSLLRCISVYPVAIIFR